MPDAERTAGSLHRDGSASKPTSIAEWFSYLTETGNFHKYWCDGSTESKAIEAGFADWKATQGKQALTLNE